MGSWGGEDEAWQQPVEWAVPYSQVVDKNQGDTS